MIVLCFALYLFVLLCRLGDHWTSGERMRRFVASYCIECWLDPVAAVLLLETAP